VPNEWQPAKAMLEQINTGGRRQRSRSPSEPLEALDPEHFAFRGTSSAGANQAARELRSAARKRQDPS
jgi:hypothetical protein